jgi:DNA-binding MarR family transcriptional regulator
MSDDPIDDPRFLALADLFIDIAREIRLRAATTTPVVPITQTQGQVMRYVHNHPGCSASDIAEGSGLQRANVSSALRELRGRGYITSRRDEEDGRAIRIEATALADDTIARLRSSWGSLLEQAWGESSTSSDALATVTASLIRLRNGLDAGRATKSFHLDAPAESAGDPDSSDPRR